VKVQTSPYERAVNSLAKTDPKLADELEKACYRSMAKDREASAQLATAIKERDEARVSIRLAEHWQEFHCVACGYVEKWMGSVPVGHEAGTGHFGPNGAGGWELYLRCSDLEGANRLRAKLATAEKERDEALRWQHSAAFLSMREALKVIADNGTAYPADVARAALSPQGKP